MTATVPRRPAAITSRKIPGGWIGEARRNGDLVCNCGHPGHLFEEEAKDCVRTMARAIGLYVPLTSREQSASLDS